MAQVEFTIPLHLEDLCKSAQDQYVVTEVLPAKQLQSRIADCKSHLRTQGPLVIIHSFDVFYSVLRHFHTVGFATREDALYILLKALPQLSETLVGRLDEDMTSDSRRHHLNALKMTCYLACQFVDAFESEFSKPPVVVTAGKGRKKASRAAMADFGDIDWEGEREMMLRGLLHIIQLPIHRLWDPPAVEEEFVSLVTSCCYKLLENPVTSKHKSTRDVIIQILGTAIKKFGHGLNCSLKLIHLLQNFEHLAVPIAAALETFIHGYGAKNVAVDMMREIGRMDPKDLARDTSGTRAYATFLIDLSERAPMIMMSGVSLLLKLLDEESYTMRNSILSVMCEIILQVLSSDELTDKDKNTRDQFLDKLEDHIHDIHAYTRSKALQLWLRIITEKALPLPRQQYLLELIYGRLMDKSSQVRRHAVQALAVLIRNNPFAGKLKVEELKTHLEEEKKKLESMQPADSVHEEAHRVTLGKWNQIKKDVKAAISQHLESDEEDGFEAEPLIKEAETADCIRSRILTHLADGDYTQAVPLYKAAVDTWPESPYFRAGGASSMSSESDPNDSGTEELDIAERLLQGLKVIFFCENLLDAVQANDPATKDPDSVTELSRQQVLVQYLQDSLGFSQWLQQSMPVISQLLGSKCTTDVLEAVELFVIAHQFGVVGAENGIRKMLVLIWSKEGSVKEAVVSAYRRLYLSAEGNGAKANAMAIANKLITLTIGATVGEITSLEQLIGEFMRLDELDHEVVKVLWEKFSLKIPGTTADESRGALQLLSMAAGAQIEVVRSNVDVLYQEGLGPRASTDLLLARDTCLALLKLTGKHEKKAGEYHQTKRYQSNHEIFTRLHELLITTITDGEQSFWIPFAEQAVAVIYCLSEKPDITCGKILKQLVDKIFSADHQEKQRKENDINVETSQVEHHTEDDEAATVGEGQAEAPAQETQGEGQAEAHAQKTQGEGQAEGHAQETQGEGQAEAHAQEVQGEGQDEAHAQAVQGEGQAEADKEEAPAGQTQGVEDDAEADERLNEADPLCSSVTLARFLSFCGGVAVRHLVHLDIAVLGELKKRNAAMEEVKSSKSKKTKNSPAKAGSSVDEAQLAEEMGLAGASADDAEAEMVRQLTEKQTVSGDGLLGRITPIVQAVCSNPSTYSDPILQASAALALAKFMMISSEFCEENLQLLFTMLEKSPAPTIRANTMIALGDLTLRFPNLIEPWTSNLYARLRDESSLVRKTTVMVLSHLILNDMVKVKGQISEVGTCIVDEEQAIAGLAQRFFLELSHKGNAIYNIMPDMVSRLSDKEIGVEEEHFQTIMRFLFGFIQKDRQCESLVEKLCHRFKGTRDERQWRDLSFCLSLMSYNEKCLRKLQDNFNTFADKLHQEDVYGHFQGIITASRKFTKPETKAILDELEQKLEQCHSQRVAEEEVSEKASKAKRRSGRKSGVGKSPGKTPRKTPGPARKPRVVKSAHKKALMKELLSDDSDEEGAFKTPGPAPTRHKQKPAAAASARRKPVIEFSSDDDDEFEQWEPSASESESTPAQLIPTETKPVVDSSPLFPQPSPRIQSQKEPTDTPRNTQENKTKRRKRRN